MVEMTTRRSATPTRAKADDEAAAVEAASRSGRRRSRCSPASLRAAFELRAAYRGGRRRGRRRRDRTRSASASRPRPRAEFVERARAGRGRGPPALPPVRPAARPAGPHLPTPKRPLPQLIARCDGCHAWTAMHALDAALLASRPRGLPLPVLPPRLTAQPRRAGACRCRIDAARALRSWRRRDPARRTAARVVEPRDARPRHPVCPPPTGPRSFEAVYKPIRGERPLDDFPDGTLGYREVAAYLVSQAIGWNIVPPTILRDGPLGAGMVQLWIDIDESVDVVGMLLRGDPAATDGAVRRGDQQRRSEGRPPAARRQAATCTASTTASASRQTRSCGRSSGAGEADPLRPRRSRPWRPSARSGRPARRRVVRARLLRRKWRRPYGGSAGSCPRRTFPQPDPDRPAIPWPPF